MAVTLRFMAIGEAYKSMALTFRTGTNNISKVVPGTCEAIIQEFMREVIVCPSDPARVEGGGSNIWQLVELP